MEITNLNDVVLDRRQNLQQQLYQYIVDRIIKGEFKGGMKLPASRQLASDLTISRNTVIKTLEQLCDEGYLESRRGSGVFINVKMNDTRLHTASYEWQSELPLPELSSYAKSLTGECDLSERNLPFAPGLTAVDEFPMAIWQRLIRRHCDRSILCGYNDTQGYLPLREALAQYLAHSRGVKCEVEQIIITQGAQQAINLCTHVLMNEHDQVIIEEPGYCSAKKAFSAYNADIKTVPLYDDSVDVTALKNDKYKNAKLLYCTPTHQYPMGGILPADKRLALLDWAVRYNTWIIEDDYDSEFHFNQKPVAAIQGLAKTTPVIYMGSFSKTLFPTIRLGYVVVPKPIVGQFVQAKSALHGETSILNQAVVADFISEGHFTRHLRRMRVLYQRKWQHFSDLLTHLPAKCQVVANSAGMHLVLKIAGINDNALQKHLSEHGFATSSLSEYFLLEKKETGLVLGFANTNSEQRERVTRLVREYILENAK